MMSLWEKFARYKFSVLFVSLLVFFIIAPLARMQQYRIMPVLFLVLMLSVISILNLHRRWFLICVSLGLTAFVSHIGGASFDVFLDASDNTFIINLVSLTAYSLFLGISIVALTGKIFSEQTVTFETIQGGIAVYFLMGLSWALLYRLVLLFEPDALALVNPAAAFPDLVYFSFTTLATLGYGDNLPVSWMARNLTILESTLGQIFLIVLIARLVGLHITHAARE